MCEEPKFVNMPVTKMSHLQKSCQKLSSDEKREICTYKAHYNSVSLSAIANYFSNRWQKQVTETTISEIVGTWLPKDDHEVNVNVCNVTMEEAREGLMKAITFVEAHPSMACYHIQTLWLVLQHLDDYAKRLQVDDVLYTDGNLVKRENDPAEQHLKYDEQAQEVSCTGEGVDYTVGAYPDVSNDRSDDEDTLDYDKDDTLDYDKDYCKDDALDYNKDDILGYDKDDVPIIENKMEQVKPDVLFNMLPENLTVGKSMTDHANFGIFSMVNLSAGIKWGPYDASKHQQGIVSRDKDDVSINDMSSSIWMRYVHSTDQTQLHNVTYEQEGDQIYLVTMTDVASGTELLTTAGSFCSQQNVNESCKFQEDIHEAGKSENVISDGKDKSIGCTCRTCKERFGDKSTLMCHQWQGCPDRTFKCTRCQRRFTKGEQLKNHLKLAHRGERTHTCPICNKTYHKNRDIARHILTHTGEKPYRCPVCNRGFSQETSIKRHMTVHTGQKSISTEDVQELQDLSSTLPAGVTMKKSNVRGVKWGIFTTMQIHTRVRWGPYEKNASSVHGNKDCDIPLGDDHAEDSDKSVNSWMKYVRFSHKDQLQNVEVLQEADKVYYLTTKVIPADTELLTSISDSIFANIKPMSKPHRCGNCNKRFQDIDSLNTHQLKQCEERRFKCETCHRCFLHLEDMEKHQAIHGKERLHTCTTCGKTFRSSRDINRHARTHTGERPYKCTVCGKGFTQQNSIKRHMVVHTGEKPYVCDICGKDFTDTSHFKRHQKIHIGDRCHVCGVCGKSFLYADKLRTHIRIHTGEKPFHCSVCNRNFACDSSFSKHKKTHNQTLF